MNRATALLIAALLTLALAPTASAQELADARAARKGRCSGPSQWRLVVRTIDADTLVMRFELRGGRAGQKWAIHVSHNGEHAFSVLRKSGDGGYVRVRRRLPNAEGTDKIAVGAVNRLSSEKCIGAVAV